MSSLDLTTSLFQEHVILKPKTPVYASRYKKSFPKLSKSIGIPFDMATANKEII